MIPHFESFLTEIDLSVNDRKDADGKAERIAKSLFSRYYPERQVFDSTCFLKVGSYGKGCGSSNHSDLEMLFVLPWDVYARINNLSGNKQSYLLQESKGPLRATFPLTALRADGQIVKAPFKTYHVEVVPAFLMPDGTFLTAHTADGGSWKTTNPYEEYRQLHAADLATFGKATHLTKMLKAWKYECGVEIKSISLEVLATVFVQQWVWRLQTINYYEWMIRDFFEFMLVYVNGWTRVPGTEDILLLGDSWRTKCQSAHQHAVKACVFEHLDQASSATLEWKKIFGSSFKGTSLLSATLLNRL